VCVLVCAILTTGCAKDPFSLRGAEDPKEQGGTYHTPVDPLIAADNLRFAMAERNIGHYVQTYADSLVCLFDFLLVARPDQVSGWGAAEESRIAGNLFDATDSIMFSWSPTAGRVDRFDDATAILYRTYTLSVFTRVGDTLAAEEFAGETVLHLGRNSLDLWWIFRWEDVHSSALQQSWSDLKSRYL
jgi:hypothetical protein